MSNYDVTFADQNRAESPLLFKLHAHNASLLSKANQEKENLKKEISNCTKTRKTVS